MLYSFEDFSLDTARRELRRSGVLISLQPQVFDLLEYLICNRERVVTKDDLLAAVWNGRIVSESTLSTRINAARSAIGDSGEEQRLLRTAYGKGIRFVGIVREEEETVLELAALFAADPAAPRETFPRLGNAACGATEEGRPCEPDAADQMDGRLSRPTMRLPRRFWSSLIGASIGALGFVALLIAALNWHSSWSREARLKPPPLSIVVLPFANLGDDREQQYFTDGVAQDLTTDLSRIGQMFVISHNTALTYRDKPIDTKHVGRELGVRYTLEGSVQRSEHQFRVSAQLSDTENAANLWAGRFDGDTGDLFALQNDITRRIAVVLNLEMIVAEAARPTEHPNVVDYILRGRAALMRPATRASRGEAIALFERALALDPQSVTAQSWLARTLATRATDQLSDSPAADIARGEGLVGRALAASPRSALAHYARATVLRAQDRFEEAIPEYEMAIASDRNWLDAYANLGQCKFYAGSLDEYIPLVEQAIRLSPRDPLIGVWFGRIGFAHLLQSHNDEAIDWLEKARNANPELPYIHSRLAAAHAFKGETKRAAMELAEARRLSGDDHYSSIARLNTEYLGVPKIRALYEDVYFAGLRMAGMPER